MKDWIVFQRCLLGVFIAATSVMCGMETDKSFTRADYEGRGSSACQDWQYEICDWLVTRCDFARGNPLSSCHEQYQSFVCRNDETAAACARALADVSCSAMPAGCGWRDVVNTEIAVAQCEEWVKMSCEKEETCWGRDLAECHEDAARTLPCIEMIGTLLPYEQCVALMKNEECDLSFAENCAMLFVRQ